MIIQSPTYSKVFGIVNKAVWYEVIDEYNPYEVEFTLTPSQQNASVIYIKNLNTNTTNEFSRSIPPTPSTSNITITTQVLHVPGIKSTNYLIFNQGV